MSFLPKDYTIPTTSNYMKFKQGANKFRILSAPIFGYEWWNDTPEGRRPERARMGQPVPVSKADDMKHFWAMTVWNYSEKRLQILEITQKSIMNAIRALSQGDEWGDPKDYDITVTREGEGLDTEYMTVPNKPTQVPNEAKEALETTDINLEALFSNEDPFKASETVGDQVEDEEDVSDSVPF